MPCDDHQFRKIDRDLVEVGASHLGRHQRTRMSDLRAERNAPFAAGGVDRIEAPIRRRHLPQPGKHADRLEAEFAHATTDLAQRRHGLRNVDGADAEKAIGCLRDEGGDLVVRDHHASRPHPGADQTLVHACLVHHREGRCDRQLRARNRALGPAAQRVEHRVMDVAQCRVLGPDVDDHRVLFGRGIGDGLDRRIAK